MGLYLSKQFLQNSYSIIVYFYASAFRRRRHYVFGLSVCLSVCPSVRPSVRPKPEITSSHLYVGPLVHPTNRDRFAACPSAVRLSVRPSGEVSGQLWREWSEILHVDVSWAPSKLIRLWSWSVDFPPFGLTLTWWNGSNLGFPGISWRMHSGNGLKFCMLMYLDHLQNWLVYGHGLLIFLNLAGFFHLVKWVKFGVSGHFLPENPLRKWPGILHADVSWAPSELIRLWLSFVDFINFGTILT